MPRSPITAKGLLLASLRDPNPVIFLEPKSMYFETKEEVPLADYEIELSKATVLKQGLCFFFV